MEGFSWKETKKKKKEKNNRRLQRSYTHSHVEEWSESPRTYKLWDSECARGWEGQEVEEGRQFPDVLLFLGIINILLIHVPSESCSASHLPVPMIGDGATTPADTLWMVLDFFCISSSFLFKSKFRGSANPPITQIFLSLHRWCVDILSRRSPIDWLRRGISLSTGIY